jgi:ubiquinone/menaquinone biosynthesis C-methylase UbiE
VKVLNLSPAEARRDAVAGNIASALAGKVLSEFRCLVCHSPFTLKPGSLVCENGHEVQIVQGIPDFASFSVGASEEKELQAQFHDDEKNNETFDEIVLRPYNGNWVHIRSWLYHLEIFRRLLPVSLGIGIPGATILNCGCGGGFEAQYFAEHGATVVGFDISQLRAEAAAARFCLQGLDGFFFRGDAAHLPFADGYFDLVLYHDSLHHVPIEEIPVAMREAIRVAKIGVVLLEAHDSPLRMILEEIGLSSSIEPSGNYVFRFRKSLMEFFAGQIGAQLVTYQVLFTKKEHCAHFYAIPIFGCIIYGAVRLLGSMLRPLGNEACIILKKTSGI